MLRLPICCGDGLPEHDIALARSLQRASGRAEAIVRGHKSVLLSTHDYASLQQCESLEDIKLFLVRSPSASCNTL